MDENLLKDINYLINDRIWVTKKSRMEAESRFKLNNILADILIIYYTFSLIALSIWALVLGSKSEIAEDITVVTLILSVGLFGITLFLSSVGFKQKANKFKESYHRLDSLETDVKKLIRLAKFKTEQEIIEEFHALEGQYIDILRDSDNHAGIDFERLVIIKKMKQFTYKLFLNFHYKNVAKWFFVFILFSFPIILTYLIHAINLKN